MMTWLINGVLIAVIVVGLSVAAKNSNADLSALKEAVTPTEYGVTVSGTVKSPPPVDVCKTMNLCGQPPRDVR